MFKDGSDQLDYYGILQVHPEAEKEVIDAAYRKLASKYHPDVSQASNTAERMKRINMAYEVLSNPSKRAAYDANRHVARSPLTPPHTAATSQHASRAWKTLLIAAGILLLAALVFRSGLGLLLLVPRLLAPFAVIALVIWLLFALTKPRR